MHEFEARLGDRFLDDIGTQIVQVVDKKLESYGKKNMSNQVFYIALLMLVLVIGGYFVMGSIKKAEKEHVL